MEVKRNPWDQDLEDQEECLKKMLVSWSGIQSKPGPLCSTNTEESPEGNPNYNLIPKNQWLNHAEQHLEEVYNHVLWFDEKALLSLTYASRVCLEKKMKDFNKSSLCQVLNMRVNLLCFRVGSHRKNIIHNYELAYLEKDEVGVKTTVVEKKQTNLIFCWKTGCWNYILDRRMCVKWNDKVKLADGITYRRGY